MDLVDGVASAHCLGNHKDTSVGRLFQCFIDIGHLKFLVAHESVRSLADHAETLLDCFLERTSDCHDLADTLHAGTNLPGHAVEFGKVPTRDFADDIVKRRFEECRSRLGNGVLQVEETVAETEFRSHECQRITGSLGCQCG